MKNFLPCVFLILLISEIAFSQSSTISSVAGAPLSVESLESLIARQMEADHMAGMTLAILNDNEVVYTQHFGYADYGRGDLIDDETIFEGASTTKPVFAWMVMKMVEEGLIDLDQPLHTYMPYEDAAHDERYKLITARMVLCHTSGFPNWRRRGPLQIQFDPGTDFSYSGEGFVFLGKVIEHLKGQPLAELMEEEIFEPFGMTNTSVVWRPAHELHKAKGHFYGNVATNRSYRPREANTAASIHTNTTDFVRFMQAVIDRRGLSEESYEELFKEQFRPSIENSYQSEEGTLAWGLGWIIEETPNGLLYQHGGNNGDFRCYFQLAADGRTGYVYFSNSDKGERMNEVLKPFLLDGTVVELSDGGLDESALRPFDSLQWTISGQHEYMPYQGFESLFFLEEGEAKLNDATFKNFMIEFDLAMMPGDGNAGVKFRMQDEGNFENYYIRMHESGTNKAMQYTPVFNGSSGWQLYNGSNYNRWALYRDAEWMHFRVAVFDDWMEVFVDDMERLNLHVFDLKHRVQAGDVAFWTDAPAFVANFKVQELESYDFYYDRQSKPMPGLEVVVFWKVSSTFSEELALEEVLSAAWQSELEWVDQPCEYNGLVNLALLREPTYDDNTVIAKFVIDAEEATSKRLEFGYSDIAKVVVNGELLYEGRRVAGSRDHSYLGTIGLFDEVVLPLKAGRNEVNFIVTEYFGGWGVVAKLSDMEGIRVTTD